jgi:hypothetical protein
MSHLAKFMGGPLHAEQRELYGRPQTYRAVQYIWTSREEYLRGELPSMPVQTKIVEYKPSEETQDGAVVYLVA